MPQPVIRNDGKPAQTPRGGSPAGSPRPADPTMAARDREQRKLTGRARTGTDGWPVHGPTGLSLATPGRTLARRAELGQLVEHHPARVQVPEGDGRRHKRRVTRRAQSTIPPR